MFVTRHAGAFLGNILGTLVYNKAHWGWGLRIDHIFWIYALMPVAFVFPWVYLLKDPYRFTSCRNLMVQFESIWTLVKRRTVWQPMSFVGWYNIFHVPNAAWEPFLLKGLHFAPYELGILSSVGAAFSFLGVGFYRAFMMNCNWRNVWIFTSLVGTIFSVMQLILIFRLNVKWHLSDLLFSLGDEVIEDFIMALHFLPLVNMFLMLCPEGAEGTSYAMITTLHWVARAASSNVSTLFARIWDVSNKALKHHNYSGLWRLSLLTGCLQLVGLVPVKLMPRGKEDMLGKREFHDFWGGVGLIGFLLLAWAWTISEAIIVLRKSA